MTSAYPWIRICIYGAAGPQLYQRYDGSFEGSHL